MAIHTPPSRNATPARRGQRAPITVGTRGSTLALWQTNWALDRVRERVPRVEFALRTITTQGDRTQARATPLAQLGDKGVFVAELERSLLSGALDVAIQPMNDHALVEAERAAAGLAVDAAIHSLKDLPSALTPGLALAAIPAREDARDALVSRHGLGLRDLPEGAVVATSSLRRRAQLLALRPDLRITEMRGNLDTRLRKALAPDGPDATILAVAGMRRLGLADHITEILPVEVLTPAAGQGALAIETRAGDRALRRLLHVVDDLPTRRAITAERAVLAGLGAGCLAPVGAHAISSPDGVTLRLLAIVATTDGTRIIRAERSGSAGRPVALARAVVADLRRQGAGAIIHAVRAALGSEAGAGR
ncbi:MAG TPA: hydroxymethylbilane synthase [Ktedonobacterales bacterium]